MIWKPIALSAVVLLVSSFGPMSSNQNKDTNQGGWKPLFDGKTTKGWHSYGKTEPSSSWVAEKGVLHLTPGGTEHGDLVTDEEYSNFHLKLEWKISKNGNSGVIFFVKEDLAKYSATYNTGMEMQVLDNDGHPDAKIYKHRAGDLYDLIASSKETVKAVGEWNQVEIISNNGKLDLILNGTTVVSTTMWDENFNSLIEGSKFKGWPGFATFKAGKIALQDHGDEVWYRNIKIQKL